MMVFDFKKFPELTNQQAEFYYWESPHKQIFETFDCEVVKVTDGDTIRVLWNERDFDFPIRLVNIAAPEKKERGGAASHSWLENRILDKEITVEIDRKNRIGKWGRILGRIIFGGVDIGEESVSLGHSVLWADRKSGVLPNYQKELDKHVARLR